MTIKERYDGVINYFKNNVPIAETELQYSNPFELIVAVILSAQCTDKRINQVTPKLFKDFPTAQVMAASNSDTIFSYIRSVSYPNNKAKHLVNMANMLITDFNGIIPSEIDELTKLPGVGRKTANVVASVIYDKPAMAVDTHVFRVSNRLGLTKAKTPLQSEQQLIKHIPKQYIATAHHWLILHGRYTCLARTPKCDNCDLKEWCNYFKTKIINKNYPHSLSIKKVTMTKINTTKKTTESKLIKETSEVKEKFINHSTYLKVGDKAPQFTSINQYGESVSLKEFKGKNIVLYFYPKDSTPGCTMEACSLRDDYKYLGEKNYVVLGVSADDEIRHKKFAEKYDLPFSLLADTSMEIIKLYDVFGTKKFMGKIYDGIIRTTFIINEKGIIAHIITDVKTKEHGKQILAL
jgi:endonuclease-3